mmetsp:Transcript_829/g.887  ORF Transcript_829/g.887 Transcript_829/m.887 type:complete len:217 (+) Transcript_829:161-811(+)
MPAIIILKPDEMGCPSFQTYHGESLVHKSRTICPSRKRIRADPPSFSFSMNFDESCCVLPSGKADLLKPQVKIASAPVVKRVRAACESASPIFGRKLDNGEDEDKENICPNSGRKSVSGIIKFDDDEDKENICPNRNTSPFTMSKVLSHDDDEDKENICPNRNSSPFAVLKTIRHEDDEDKENICPNRNSPPLATLKIMKHEDDEDKENICPNRTR